MGSKDILMQGRPIQFHEIVNVTDCNAMFCGLIMDPPTEVILFAHNHPSKMLPAINNL